MNEAVKAAGPVVKQVTPEITKAVTSAIENTGIDLNAVTSTTSTVVKVASEQAAAASPLVTKVVTFLSGQQPTLIAEAAVGFAAIYVITPVLFKGLVGSVRGFAGELTAVKALDVINNEGNVVLVDIRTAREKEASGLPDIASSASSKLVEVEYAFTEDRKLRSQLRDVGAVEAAVTALQVSALKRVNKGTKIVLMCRYGGSAKAVAKELAKRGFGNVFTVANGFDGRGGWVSSKLQIKPAATMYSTTSSSGGSGFSFGTKSKALPAPKA